MNRFFLACLLTLVVFLSAGCSARFPESSDRAGLVDIGGGRNLYLECRGSGSPTVVLVSGTGGASDEWTHIFSSTDSNNTPVLSDSAVFQQVSRITRVCAYDRPGTTRFDGAASPSTPVTQPTSAQEGVSDLYALLHAANVPGPFVLVGASWGGMITKLYASKYPNDVAGMVFVDGASEFLENTFTPAQWSEWMTKIKEMLALKDAEVPDYVSSVQALRESSGLPKAPAVVLTSDKPWQLLGERNPTWQAWLDAQNMLARELGAKHISNTNSGHGIAVEQPQLVIDAIRQVVEASRAERATP